MSKHIVIIGDGAMGTVCAALLAENGNRVTMWSHTPEQAQSLATHQENKLFLPGVTLPKSIKFTGQDEGVFDGADLIVSAIPCAFLRGVWKRLADHKPSKVPVVSITKGIENQSLARPTQIIEACVGPCDLAVLSGPNIADELIRRLPATSTAASTQDEFAQLVQSVFTNEWLRIYTNNDMIGVELAGATKNVIAIAAGMIDGLKAGDNAKAALLTRGLVEISRLGVAMGAQPNTFAGLSGMGDLVTTCISPKGRNRTFGELIGRGHTPDDALKKIPGQVEGVNTCRSLVALAKKNQIEMPITQAVYQILFENKPPAEAITDLMRRKLKPETAS